MLTKLPSIATSVQEDGLDIKTTQMVNVFVSSTLQKESKLAMHQQFVKILELNYHYQRIKKKIIIYFIMPNLKTLLQQGMKFIKFALKPRNTRFIILYSTK